MTLVRFDLICGSDRGSDRQITRLEMSAVPLPGETVNINGDPFVVHERSWAVTEEPSKTYAYLRVTKLQALGVYDIDRRIKGGAPA